MRICIPAVYHMKHTPTAAMIFFLNSLSCWFHHIRCIALIAHMKPSAAYLVAFLCLCRSFSLSLSPWLAFRQQLAVLSWFTVCACAYLYTAKDGRRTNEAYSREKQLNQTQRDHLCDIHNSHASALLCTLCASRAHFFPRRVYWLSKYLHSYRFWLRQIGEKIPTPDTFTVSVSRHWFQAEKGTGRCWLMSVCFDWAVFDGNALLSMLYNQIVTHIFRLSLRNFDVCKRIFLFAIDGNFLDTIHVNNAICTDPRCNDETTVHRFFLPLFDNDTLSIWTIAVAANSIRLKSKG